MEMKCLREPIQMERLVGSAQSQAAVEGEITLPGGLREEARVLSAGGMAVIDAMEALQDQVVLTGRVVFHALYTQGDPDKLQAMEASAEFTHTMEVPGAQPRMLCRGGAVVEHVEASAASGRLNLRAVLQARCRVLSAQPMPILTGLAEVPGLEMQTQALPLKRTVAQGEAETLLREEFDLPQGLEITQTLYATARPQVTEITGGLGRAGISGAIALEVYHASATPGKPLCLTRHTLPFDQTVELSGEDGELLDGHVCIKDVAVVSQEGAEGERTLRAEVLLGLSAWADRQEEVTILRDAYTTHGSDLQLTSSPVCVRIGDHRAEAAESGKAMLLLPEGSPAARTVLCGFAAPVLTGREQIGGRLTVEGMLEVTLLYMTDDSDAPVAVFQEEPFRMTLALHSAPEDFLTLQVDDIEVSAITSDRVEMKYILHVSAAGISAQETAVVTEAELVDADAPSDCLILYFTQPGESAWDIARRYRLPRTQLEELNPALSQGEPLCGQSLLVWRRMAEA